MTDLYLHWAINGNPIQYSSALLRQLYSVLQFCCARQYILKDRIEIRIVKKSFIEEGYQDSDADKWLISTDDLELLEADIVLSDNKGTQVGLFLSQNQITIFTLCELEIQADSVIDEIGNAIFKDLDDYVAERGSKLDGGNFSKSIPLTEKVSKKTKGCSPIAFISMLIALVACVFTILGYLK